jgi:hypothetical protein
VIIFLPVADGPSWTDIGTFVVGIIGTIASTAVAVVAIVLSTKAVRAEADRARRDRRAEWARDFSIWIEAGTKYLLIPDAAILDDEWVATATSLSSRARVLDSPGATDLMVAAKRARSEVSSLPPETSTRVALTMTSLIQLWAQQWVEKPREGELAVEEWAQAFAATNEDAP